MKGLQANTISTASDKEEKPKSSKPNWNQNRKRKLLDPDSSRLGPSISRLILSISRLYQVISRLL